MLDRRGPGGDDAGPPPAPRMTDTERPYLPIAVGFYLLALPLAVAVFLAGSAAGAWTNGIAASVMLGLGLLRHRFAR